MRIGGEVATIAIVKWKKGISQVENEKTVLPNPHLKGGEMHLANFSSAKQAAYVERRRQHREAWWEANRQWLAARGTTEHDGPPMGDRE